MVDRRPKIGLKVLIPVDLHAQVALLLLDPAKGRVEHGGWTGLLEMLLRRWVEEQRAQARDADSGNGEARIARSNEVDRTATKQP